MNKLVESQQRLIAALDSMYAYRLEMNASIPVTNYLETKNELYKSNLEKTRWIIVSIVISSLLLVAVLAFLIVLSRFRRAKERLKSEKAITELREALDSQCNESNMLAQFNSDLKSRLEELQSELQKYSEQSANNDNTEEKNMPSLSDVFVSLFTKLYGRLELLLIVMEKQDVKYSRYTKKQLISEFKDHLLLDKDSLADLEQYVEKTHPDLLSELKNRCPISMMSRIRYLFSPSCSVR